MGSSVAWRFFRGLFYGALGFTFVYAANSLSGLGVPQEVVVPVTALLLAADKAVRALAASGE